MKKILLLKDLKIHNANALSSLYTIGFPAVTTWLGAVHNIQRHLNTDYKDLKFIATGIICHDIKLHTHRGITQKGYKHDFSSIVSTANPLKSDGTRPAIIPEARCHLTVSLVIEYTGNLPGDYTKKINNILYKVKFAGGDLISPMNDNIKFNIIRDDDEKYKDDLAELRKQISLGWWLIDRSDLIKKHLKENTNKNALDAVLDHMKIYHKYQEGENKKKIRWVSEKKELGWLVPIAVGFNGLTENLGKVRNQRDTRYEHRFVEPIITLGEFKMIFTQDDCIEQVLWQTSYDSHLKQYLCKQCKQINH